MPNPVSTRRFKPDILKYAQEIGVDIRFPPGAEVRRKFDNEAGTPEERAKKASLFFDDFSYAKVREFNSLY